MSERAARGEAKDVEFVGTGLGLLVQWIIAGVLMSLTFGLYWPWAVVQLSTWWNERTVIQGVAARFEMKALDYLVEFLKIWLLRIVTLGLYSPWGYCRMQRFIDAHASVNGRRISFTGTGLERLALWLLWFPIIVLTFSLAWPWAACSFQRWHARNTWIDDRPLAFHGNGRDVFLSWLWRTFLVVITLGLYRPWYETHWGRFTYSRTTLEAPDPRRLSRLQNQNILNRAVPAFGAVGALAIIATLSFNAEARSALDVAVDAVESRAREKTSTVESRLTPAPPTVARPEPAPPVAPPAPALAPAVPAPAANDGRTIRRDGNVYIWTDEKGRAHITDERGVPADLLLRINR